MSAPILALSSVLAALDGDDKHVLTMVFVVAIAALIIGCVFWLAPGEIVYKRIVAGIVGLILVCYVLHEFGII